MKTTSFATLQSGTAKNGHSLTVREVEVLVLAADGHSNKEIAGTLNISHDTVDTHNRNIVAKLEARNMKHAIAIAIRKKIIR